MSLVREGSFFPSGAKGCQFAGGRISSVVAPRSGARPDLARARRRIIGKRRVRRTLWAVIRSGRSRGWTASRGRRSRGRAEPTGLGGPRAAIGSGRQLHRAPPSRAALARPGRTRGGTTEPRAASPTSRSLFHACPFTLVSSVAQQRAAHRGDRHETRLALPPRPLGARARQRLRAV